MPTFGLISDTHGLLRPQAVKALQYVDLIVHAGDIGKSQIIDSLAEIAPVRAIRGNIDNGDWANTFPVDDVIEAEGVCIYVLHRLQDLEVDPRTAGFDVVISGHSHRPEIKRVDGVLFVNPGSAGPRRFSLPVAVALLNLGPQGPDAEIVELAV